MTQPSKTETTACQHEPYYGRCVHCGVLFAYGRPIEHMPRWRHVRRGTTYAEIGRAELQVATTPPLEGYALVIYCGDDGRLWARKESEFEDGRFERLVNAE